MGLSTKIIVFLQVSASLQSLARAYSDGAPKEACSDMTPKHGVSAQVGASHAHLVIVKGQHFFGPGERLDIRLLVPEPYPSFKGFLIQAKNSDGKIVGHFDASRDPHAKILDCDHEVEGS